MQHTLIKAVDAAKFFLWYAQSKGDQSFTCTELSILLYFAQIEFIRISGMRLFEDSMYKVDNLPMIEAIERKYRKHGRKKIIHYKTFEKPLFTNLVAGFLVKFYEENKPFSDDVWPSMIDILREHSVFKESSRLIKMKSLMEFARNEK